LDHFIGDEVGCASAVNEDGADEEIGVFEMLSNIYV
jgi:hypothetical protein